MAVINHTIPGLYNGVSQQSPDIRLESQCEESINCKLSVVDGVSKRLPTDFRKGDIVADDNSKILTIKKGDEEYLFVLNSNEDEPLSIYNIKNNYEKKIIHYDDFMLGYLTYNLTNARKDLDILNLADTTLLLNKNVIVRALSNFRVVKNGIVLVKKGLTETIYRIEFLWNDKRVQLLSNSDSNSDTSSICQGFIDNMKSDFTDYFTYEKFDDSLYFVNKDGDDFTINVSDSFDSNNIAGFTTETDTTDNLPAKTFGGYKVNINPDLLEYGGYYLQYSATTGIWSESRGYGVKTLNSFVGSSTLPIKIEEVDGEFYVRRIVYKDKKAGDDYISKNPSFIDNTISKMFFYKNRLCFVSGQNLIFSRNDDYFNFFNTTTTTILDDEFIDININSVELSDIAEVSTFNENLIVFTEENQFNISSNGSYFSASNLSATQLTNFKYNKKCNSVSVGSNLYFANNNGNFSTVREYFIEPNSLVNDANNITIHVPEYIYNDLTTAIYEKINDTLYFLKSGSNIIYTYNFKWQNNEKIQSAWSKIDFDFNIIDLCIVNDTLTMLIKNDSSNGEVPFISYDIIETDLKKSNDIYLDRLIKITDITYEDGYAILTDTEYTFKNKSGMANLDSYYFIIDDLGNYVTDAYSRLVTDKNTVKFSYDRVSSYFLVGIKYKSEYTINELNIKAAGTNVAENAGRLQIRNMKLNYLDTVDFKVAIKTKGSSIVRYPELFNGNLDKSGYYYVVPSNIEKKDGEFKFMVASKNSNIKYIKVTSDTFYNFKIQSMSWIGYYTKNSLTV